MDKLFNYQTLEIAADNKVNTDVSNILPLSNYGFSIFKQKYNNKYHCRLQISFSFFNFTIQRKANIFILRITFVCLPVDVADTLPIYTHLELLRSLVIFLTIIIIFTATFYTYFVRIADADSSPVLHGAVLSLLPTLGPLRGVAKYTLVSSILFYNTFCGWRAF
jgi:hypothetical protein